jgi:hypothetical protein
MGGHWAGYAIILRSNPDLLVTRTGYVVYEIDGRSRWGSSIDGDSVGPVAAPCFNYTKKSCLTVPVGRGILQASISGSDYGAFANHGWSGRDDDDGFVGRGAEWGRGQRDE